MRTLLAAGTARLAAAGVEQARREARLLLHHMLGLPHGALADPEALADAGRYDALLRRREAREPLALITGRRGFWTLDLAVSAATLVPRADSETLIEAARDYFAARPAPRRILDLGSGTGCLVLAALTLFPTAFGIGVDVSPAAAALACGNARRNGLAARAAFLAGNWAEPLAAGFDLILSNPPYIPSAEIDALMPEVRLHEPERALNGGADGLDAYRAILAALPRLLRPDGLAVLELGHGQAEAVRALAEAQGLHYVGRRADLGGIARALLLGRGAARTASETDTGPKGRPTGRPEKTVWQHGRGKLGFGHATGLNG